VKSGLSGPRSAEMVATGARAQQRGEQQPGEVGQSDAEDRLDHACVQIALACRHRGVATLSAFRANGSTWATEDDRRILRR
jgi:hypothetical protein